MTTADTLILTTDPEGNPWFARPDTVEDVASAQRALAGSRSWGEFWEALTGRERGRVKARFPKGALPAMDADFNPSEIPGYDDGDYPLWPAAAMLDELPTAVIREFGEVRPSALQGDRVTFRQHDVSAIVARLASLGIAAVAPRPNLFGFAVSKLAQDAFLAWLLAWADPGHATTDPALHAAGRRLLGALFARTGSEPPDAGASVHVQRQVEGADLVVRVGTTHVLILEDKTDTDAHGNQLERYPERIAARYPGRQVLKVFLKTRDQASYDAVRHHGWALFQRGDLLAVLRACPAGDNAVYRDFLDHLEQVERDVQRYRTAPVAHWTARDAAYTGLFLALQTALGPSDWRYIPNPRGGLMGFWWGQVPHGEGEVYLMLEATRAVVKVSVDTPDRRQPLRDAWNRAFTGAGFAQPDRLGHGSSMVVAVAAEAYLRTREDGLLDLEATIAGLNTITQRYAAVVRAQLGPT